VTISVLPSLYLTELVLLMAYGWVSGSESDSRYASVSATALLMVSVKSCESESVTQFETASGLSYV